MILDDDQIYDELWKVSGAFAGSAAIWHGSGQPHVHMTTKRVAWIQK